MDVNVGNTGACALNDVLKLIGLDETTQQVIEDIYYKNDETLSTIYKWLVALTLGRNFGDKRVFIKSLVADYLNPKIEFPDVDIINRTQSTLTESVNNYIYLVLESYEYNRLSKITLDDKQDPQELFLAVAFLISKDKWFQLEDCNSLEIMQLKDVIVEYASNEFEGLNITEGDLNAVREYNLRKETESLNGITNNKNITNGTKDKFKVDSIGEQTDELIEKTELFEQFVMQFASDITSKATLLSRRKTVRSYDSELLRLIMGKSEYEKQFLKSIDNIYSNETDMTREGFDKKLYDEDFSEDIGDPNEWNELIRDIVHLSNVIVQLQFKLRDLSKSIENNDRERLKYFSKMTDELKNYHKKSDLSGQSTFISDRYKQPSPVEFLFISDELLFKRHMSIMNIINRSLDNEIRRADFWMKALEILENIEKMDRSNEKEGLKYQSSSHSNKNNNILTVYCKPSDIKYNVHILKSFLVEGIPTENFSVKQTNNDSRYFKSSLDFLRQVNVKFANFKAGQVTDKHGRKTTFSMFVSNEVENAKMKGFLNENDIQKINDCVKKFFHLYENVDVRKARMSIPLLGKWIDGTENFENIPRSKGRNLSEAVINSISDSKTEEYEELDKSNFRIIENIVNGVYEPEPTDNEGPIQGKIISDIINYEYYFNMCKENDGMAKDIDIDCLGFTKEIESLILEAIDCTGKNLEKSNTNLQKITDFIKSNTPLHLMG